MRGVAVSQRAAAAAPQQPRAAAGEHLAVLGNCSAARAPSGARCDAAVQTDPAEPASSDAHDTWARLAAVVAQDPRVVQSLQSSFRELAASRALGESGDGQAPTEDERAAADSAAFTAALAAALAAGVAAAGDSFGLAPATADATRWARRLRRGPAFELSDSDAPGGPGAAPRRASKPRLRWTPELAASFEAAVASLGGLQSAAPQQILNRMRQAGEGPPELNLAHLKSHLQKCRIADQRRRAAAAAAVGASAAPEAGAGGGAEGIALLLRLAAASHEPQTGAAPAEALPPAKPSRRR